MQALLNLRTIIANYRLQHYLKILGNRVNHVQNFSIKNVRTIIILFDATVMADVELIKKLIDYYKQEGKVVKAIGYINQQEFKPLLLPKSDFELFCLREVSFDFTPKTNWHTQFINYNYDLIINTDANSLAPLNYLYAHSTAKFKLAVETPNNKVISNITIDCSTDKSLKYFLRNTDHYLKLINA